MADTHVNRLRCTVSAVASAGLGAFTISTASSGYRTFGAAQDGQTFTVLVTEGTAWEVNTGCTYTHSGTSLSRGTLADSSTGSAITFTTAAVITEVASAAFGNRTESALQSVVPGGRLTLESGVPVSTSDQTAKTTIYYTPYVHNIINLWDGANWVPTSFSETSEALGTLTSGLPYDVFGFLSGGVLDLEKLAWTNGTTRATAVTLQDGRYCKSGDKTRLLLGTFYTTATTTTEDGVTNRFVFNVYNRVSRPMFVNEATAHTYASSTPRTWNNANGTRLRWFAGLGASAALSATIRGSVASGENLVAEIYLDGAAITGADIMQMLKSTADTHKTISIWRGHVSAGLRTSEVWEWSATGTVDYTQANNIAEIEA